MFGNWNSGSMTGRRPGTDRSGGSARPARPRRPRVGLAISAEASSLHQPVGVLALVVVLGRRDLVTAHDRRHGRVRRGGVDVHGQVVVQGRQTLLEHGVGVTVVGDDVEAGLANSGIMSAWVSSRRLLPVLIIHRISGTAPSFSQKPSPFLVQPFVGQQRLGRGRVVAVRRTGCCRTTGRPSAPRGRTAAARSPGRSGRRCWPGSGRGRSTSRRPRGSIGSANGPFGCWKYRPS